MEWIAQLFWPYDIDDSRRIWSLFLILARWFFSTHNLHTFPQPIFIFFSIFSLLFANVAKNFLFVSFLHTRDYRFFPPFSSFLFGVGMDAGKKKISEISALLRDFLTQPSKCEGMEKREKKCSLALTGHLAWLCRFCTEDKRLMKMKKSRLISMDGWRIK